jgi:hypothetical protein
MMHPENFRSWLKRIGIGTLLVILIGGCAAPEVEQLESVSTDQKPGVTSAKISRISTESLIGKMRITLEANSEITYTAFKLTDPLRLVLDLPHLDSSEVSELTFQAASPVMRIHPFQFTDGGSVNSRYRGCPLAFSPVSSV